jgi:ribosomal protein S18 acetylase RimI-like enzyme
MAAPLTYKLRPAELDDLPLCLEVDCSYITSHVWQMTERMLGDTELPDEEENIPARNRAQMLGKQEKRPPVAFITEFRPSRLPRPLAMPSPWNDQQLLGEWKRTDFLLVAEALNPAPSTEAPPEFAVQKDKEVVGYIGVTVDGPRHLAWVTSGGVHSDYRRRGIGTALLNETRRWADRYRLRTIMIELQTKNYPAITFLQQNGFFYCGYNSSYYATREIALFFALRLEKPR